MKEVKVSKVLNFVKNELCREGTEKNAELRLAGAFIGGKELKLTFHKQPEELYRRMLSFCAAYGVIILKTDPVTLEMVIRARNDVNKYFVVNRENKEVIKEVQSLQEGKQLITDYEKEDKRNGVYEKGFYDIIDDSRLSYLYDVKK